MKKKRYIIVAMVVVLVLVLYYVIDYAVISNIVRRNVGKNLDSALQSVAQVQPSILTSLAPLNRQSDIFNNVDNRYLVVNPSSYFVREQVENATWLGINNDLLSPICLVTDINISLTPDNLSILGIAHVRFVGPFGVPQSINLSEMQPVKQFSVK